MWGIGSRGFLRDRVTEEKMKFKTMKPRKIYQYDDATERALHSWDFQHMLEKVLLSDLGDGDRFTVDCINIFFQKNRGLRQDQVDVLQKFYLALPGY